MNLLILSRRGEVALSVSGRAEGPTARVEEAKQRLAEAARAIAFRPVDLI